MNAELWAEIRRLHLIDKVPLAEVARRLRLDRKTVRRALRTDRLPTPARPAAPGPSKLDAFKSYLAERLTAHPRLPATVLIRDLKRQGYPGSLRVLQRYLQDVREKARPVFLRIETGPGEQAQCDWAHCGSVRIGKTWRKLSAFVMVLSHSRLLYVEFTLSQSLEDFIQGHLNAFRFFGGAPRRVLYDNLKSVVLARVGPEVLFNPSFMEFAGVFGFKPVPCNVARGNEKGKVENGIYYLRINFLAGRTLHWPDVNSDVQAWLAQVANVRMHRTTRERPLDRWEREKPFLLPLPSRPYDPALPRAVRSTHQALVRFDGNFYSVPHRAAYKTLTLKASSDRVRLFLEDQEIAAHPRCFERGQVIDDPKHYEGILATKRKHFHQILHKRFLELGPLAQAFLDGLVAAEVSPARHLQQVLNLVSAYGKDEVLTALDHATSANAFGASYVQNILLQRRAARGLPELAPLHIPQRPDWNNIDTPEPDLAVYDQALDAKERP